MEDYEKLIWKKIDGELSREEMADFVEHMKHSDFRQKYNQLVRMNNLLDQMPAFKAPVSVLDNIMSAVDFPKVYIYNFPGLKRIIAIGASVAALALLINFNFSSASQAGFDLKSFMEQWGINFQVPRSSSRFISYALALFALSGLLIIDQIYGKTISGFKSSR